MKQNLLTTHFFLFLAQLTVELLILITFLAIARVMFLMHKIMTGHSKYLSKPKRKCKTIICIGSGGHTTEMLKLLKNFDCDKYFPRYYFVASNDTTSLTKVQEFEKKKNQIDGYKIIRIPRSRVVHQSYITSILTTVYSIIYSFPIVCIVRPDLVLCNGPGTCIPICGISFLLKAAFITSTKIIFVESFCRTKTFSLTGKILTYLADNFVVQWPYLTKKLKRAEYIGQLMYAVFFFTLV